MGVQLSDNLSAAYLVLLLEGTEDETILRPVLKQLSPLLGSAFDNMVLTIDHLAGATNLGYKARLYKTLLCNVHAYVDDDAEGRHAIEAAERSGSLLVSEYNVTSQKGMSDAEIEDLLDPAIYTDVIKQVFGVELQGRTFRNNKRKWSDRVRDCFRADGKVWNDKLESRVKKAVAEAAASAGKNGLKPSGLVSVQALVRQLEAKLEKVQQSR
ncbi:MAG: hypothetical protein P8020_21615 [Acidobacteriota bacterium]